MGTILAYNGELKDIPKKWALCDGNNGTPNLTGRFLQGWGSDDFNMYSIGDYISPGLPNITGQIGPLFHPREEGGWMLFKGAFYHIGFYRAQNHYDEGYIYSFPYGGFDASRCSAIYGASNTVQPRSYIVYYIMKLQK